jgi:chemotaxis protein methyltransferase CheR
LNENFENLMQKGIEKHIRLLKEQYALDVSIYDHSFLEKAFQSRMNATFCQNLDSYFQYLGKISDEPFLLLGQLSNSYSEFFRNPLTFSMLEQAILPRLFNLKEKIHSPEIRIWSAACASGQEAYSLAILLNDYKEKNKTNIGYRILATDNSESELETARKGIFDLKTLKNTPIGFAENYFSRTGDTFILNQAIREQLDFSCYDLLSKDSSSPPSGIYGDYDLIMCCNVLFYYEPAYQKIILNKIHRSLKPGGFFITGEAETHLVNAYGGFRPYAIPSAIFVKS